MQNKEKEQGCLDAMAEPIVLDFQNLNNDFISLIKKYTVSLATCLCSFYFFHPKRLFLRKVRASL